MVGHREPRYRVLGPLAVSSDDGTPVALRGDLQRRLVAALVLHAQPPAGDRRRRPTCCGATRSPTTSPARCRRTSPGSGALLPPDALVYGEGGYCLDVSDDELDSDRFDRMVTEGIQARYARPDEAIELFDAALAPVARSAVRGVRRLGRGPRRGIAARGTVVARQRGAVRRVARRRTPRGIARRPRQSRRGTPTARPDPGAADDRAVSRRSPARGVAGLRGPPAPPRRRARARPVSAAARPRALDARPHARRPAASDTTVVGSTASILPHPATRLIGRDRLVGELRDTLGTARTVTITGPGGVGKTRVAVELAHIVDSESGHGESGQMGLAISTGSIMSRSASWRPWRHGDEVVPAVATTLGVESRAEIPLESRLVEALRGRRVLLVLDNCEHVIDAAAALVERIVAATTTVSVLATSRERLAVSGEHVCAVEPLDDVIAGELFVERSRAVRPGFTPSEAEQADVLYICQRLDGLPLAIELAAARSQALSVREIADALSQRFRLLTGGRRTAERHRSLVETVRWSFDLLDDHERDVCEQLAVFSGGATVESVAGVAGLDRVAAADVLARLVERSLLAPGICRCARDDALPDARDGAPVRNRPPGRAGRGRRGSAGPRPPFRAVCERAVRLAAPTGRRRSGVRRDRCRAGQSPRRPRVADRPGRRRRARRVGRLAVRLRVPSHASRDLRVGRGRRSRSLRPNDPHRADFLDSACFGRWQFGDVDGAWAALREGMALAEPGTRAHRGLIAAHANLEGRAGNLDVAIPLAVEAAALAAAVGDTIWFAVERFQELLFRRLTGDTTAVEEAERWTAEAQSEGNPIVSCWARYAAGEVLAPDDPERARRHTDAALELAEAIRLPVRQGCCRPDRGVARGSQRRSTSGRRCLSRVARAVAARLTRAGRRDDHARRRGGARIARRSRDGGGTPRCGRGEQRRAGVRSGRVSPGRGETAGCAATSDRGAFAMAVERGGQLDDVELRELAAVALDRAGSAVHQRG